MATSQLKEPWGMPVITRGVIISGTSEFGLVLYYNPYFQSPWTLFQCRFLTQSIFFNSYYFVAKCTKHKKYYTTATKSTSMGIEFPSSWSILRRSLQEDTTDKTPAIHHPHPGSERRIIICKSELELRRRGQIIFNYELWGAAQHDLVRKSSSGWQDGQGWHE